MALRRSIIPLVSLGCLIALGGGCASYEPAPLSAAAGAATLETRTLSDPRLHKFIAASLASDDKPRISSSPSWGLRELTLAALYFHPEMAVARAKLAAARAAVVTARQMPNPSLNFTSMFTTAAVAGAIPAGAIPATIGPVINFVIETADKREYRTGEAQHLADSARCDLATTAWQVRGRLRAALMSLWAAQQRLALARDRLTFLQELVALLESRLGRGEASSLDVTRERISRAQAELSIRETERSVADAKAELAAAIGIPAQALEPVAISSDIFEHPKPPRQTISELRRLALTHRTDVQANLAAYEAAQSALRLEIANQYPNVILGPGYNYDIGVNRYILSPTIDLPIFNQHQGEIGQALANREEAAANFNALQAHILGAIEKADADYRAATRSLATADSLVADEERHEREVSKSLAAGEIDRSALVTARLERAVVQASRFDVVVTQRQALGALEDALEWPIFGAADILTAGYPACAAVDPSAPDLHLSDDANAPATRLPKQM